MAHSEQLGELVMTVVKVRACVFIPVEWLLAFDDPSTGSRIEYEGDNREFAPRPGNASSSRIEQEVIVDFGEREVSSHAKTGISRERKRGADGTVCYREGKCDTSGITVQDIAWQGGAQVAFDMHTCAGNPLIGDAAATADYLVHVTVSLDGRVTLKGAHDGFPCYEFYKQVDSGELHPLYTFDHRVLGTTPAALAGPMEYRIDSTG